MWSVYIIRCSNNSLYTGISNDVPKRFKVHQSGSNQAAKYTRNKHPLQLVFSSEIGNKAAASRAEYRLKKLSKRNKELLVTGKTSLFNLGIIETKI
ncbi:GIY-YIG nuclease family protein [Myxosarcina sp. GI1]|uniref:GIY-YIG nuclease family protein n=1 Tax=Myxosarcina sp. GI1 TaxID=1541065 RepID=UPI00055B3F0B|nr:GIY-YIG nuclease family protein [Myxosarcina sp. GI1]